MNIRNRFVAAILTLIVACGAHFVHAQDTIKTVVPILNYTADLVVNTHGGIKTGAVYQGYGEAGILINPWKNGQFNFSIASTHGGEPTGTLVGDWQEMDNKEASNHIFALNAWYRHTFNRVTLMTVTRHVTRPTLCKTRLLAESRHSCREAMSPRCPPTGWA